MKNTLRIISFILIGASLLCTGCNDAFEGEIVKDNRPPVPVTYPGSTSYGFNPYYTVSFADDDFSIVISIPDNLDVSIAEITNSVAGTTAINVASLTAASSIPYVANGTTVNAKTYTINTSITEFNTKVAVASRITAAPAAGVLVERAFMFRLTLSDGTTVVPVQCRIRITP
jgi:hypothetical protein